MPATIQQLQAQLDAVNAAIASGVSTVDYPERGRVTYRSLSDLFAIRDDLARQIGGASGSPTSPSRRSVAAFSNGA